MSDTYYIRHANDPNKWLSRLNWKPGLTANPVFTDDVNKAVKFHDLDMVKRYATMHINQSEGPYQVFRYSRPQQESPDNDL